MKQGDFTELAKNYIHRAGYSETVIQALIKLTGAANFQSYCVADLGAGTGKLTINLLDAGLSCIAVEPNAAMFIEGQRLTSGRAVRWHQASAENTGLAARSLNWVLMGSSFHWTDKAAALKEFKRILTPGGYFSALWNPRDLEHSALHSSIEALIKNQVPDLKRVSSGAAEYTKNLEEELTAAGLFKNPILMEAKHSVIMSKERYLGAWRSVNDIQAQAGVDKFNKILKLIECEIKDLDQIEVPYKTRAWSVQLA